jgi:hypothetical protein
MWLVQLQNSPEKVEGLCTKTKIHEHVSKAHTISLYDNVLYQRPFAYLQIIRIVRPTRVFTLSTVLERPPPTNQLRSEELWKVRLGQVRSGQVSSAIWSHKYRNMNVIYNYRIRGQFCQYMYKKAKIH